MQNMLANVALVAAELKVEVDRLKARVHVLEERAEPNRDWVEGFLRDFSRVTHGSGGTAVLTGTSAELENSARIAELLGEAPEPTDELRELMKGDALDRAHHTDDPWNGDKE